MSELVEPRKHISWKEIIHKLRFLLIGLGCIIFLYVMYFAFCFNAEPFYIDRSNFWKDGRNIAFHIICWVLLFGGLVTGVYLFINHKLNYRIAAIIIALMGGIFVMIYGLSTPIYNYNGGWNQHDLYYGSIWSRYYMEDKDILDGGGGHFGMIMTIYRYNILPEIIQHNGVSDFSFSAVLERYQPKLFYLISALFMKFQTIFIPANEGLVSIDGSTAYNLTNQEWALFESLRLLYTMMEWAQIYFIYKIFVRLKLQQKPLLIAFALAIFNPMWCYFANWANNDGMSTFFSIIAIYYVLCYMQDGKTYQLLLTALGIGCSMACKLGGALTAIIVAPLLIYRFIKSFKAPKQERKGPFKNLPEWGFVMIQYVAFALIVFPLGLGFPIYNYVRFGQDIVFFSPVNNEALYIVNENFAERFLLFPNADTFRLLWVYHSNRNTPAYIQDTSLITAIIKTSLYGEYGFGLSFIQCLALYISALALIFFMMFVTPYRIVRFIRSKAKQVNPLRIYLFAAIIIVCYGWAVYFVNSYPHTCNEDMRYIPLIILPLAGLVGTTYQYFEDHENIQPIALVGKGVIISCASLFVFCAALTYLTLSPWYVG